MLKADSIAVGPIDKCRKEKVSLIIFMVIAVLV